MGATSEVRDKQRAVASRLVTLAQEIDRSDRRMEELTTEQAENGQARDALDKRAAEIVKRIAIVGDSRKKLVDQQITAKEEEAKLAALAAPPKAKQPETGRGSEGSVLEAANRFGMFSAADLAAVLKLTPKVVTGYLVALEKKGEVRDTGQKFQRQTMYEAVAAVEEEAHERELESVRLVRDWVCERGKHPGSEFAPADASQALELEPAEVEHAIGELLRREIIVSVGVEGMPLYNYVPPIGAGAAAEKDAARRKTEAQQSVRTGVAPVQGTGRKLVISDKDVAKLVADAQAAGATVTHATNGHFDVAWNGASRQIAATPGSRRSVLNDRAALRRKGLAV